MGQNFEAGLPKLWMGFGLLKLFGNQCHESCSTRRSRTVRFLLLVPNFITVPIQGRSSDAHVPLTRCPPAAHVQPMRRQCAAHSPPKWEARGRRAGGTRAAHGWRVGVVWAARMGSACGWGVWAAHLKGRRAAGGRPRVGTILYFGKIIRKRTACC